MIIFSAVMALVTLGGGGERGWGGGGRGCDICVHVTNMFVLLRSYAPNLEQDASW